MAFLHNAVSPAYSVAWLHLQTGGELLHELSQVQCSARPLVVRVKYINQLGVYMYKFVHMTRL